MASEQVTAQPPPGRVVRGATAGSRPWLRRVTLLVIAGVAALAYAWALGQDPLEPYYQAAVRSMSMSWHDFLYGAFDPAGTITLDKLPGAFWLQALAVRAFGYHPWAMVAPQMAEGVLTVLVAYRAVQRLAGPGAGLIAAAVLAVSPATVALNRGNISDSLMILLLVLAADAVSAAVVSGRLGWLVLAGIWVGLAFQAKMVEAWLVLPAFGLVYLVSGPGPAWRRVRQLVAAGLVAGVVSLSWMTAVSVLPAAHRPYIDGSHGNSAYQQVFVYNGFGRFGDQTPLQLLAGQAVQTRGAVPVPAASPARLLHGDLGRDTGWLLPAAVVIAGWGIIARWRQPRGDPLRACFILWGGWLVLLAVVFSLTTTINPYYTAALTPAVAAILGAGAAVWWSADRPAAQEPAADRPAAEGPAAEGPVAEPPSRWPAALRRAGLAVVLAGTVGYAAWLVSTAGPGAPGWLRPAVLGAGLAALVVVLGSVGRRGAAMAGAALAAALAGGLVAPAVASAGLVARHEGAFDTPFEPARQHQAIDALLDAPAQVAQTIPRLQSIQLGAPYLMATQTSALASVFIDDSGLEVLPIGGFTGTIPSPTLGQLRADVRTGRFHLALITSPAADPQVRWIATHCMQVGRPTARVHNYFCEPTNAG